MYNKQTYYRLVALWVICETMLGGIIHGLKLPVSGLIVGGSAVICICMIANYYPVRGSILKATIVVAIFKMMLSPQSPMPAYIAVFFQGIAGELIFLNRKAFRMSCIVFGVVALFESGVQRLLVMTIFFGTQIWEAINIFISGITGEKTVTNYSYYLASGYVLLHIVAGFVLGWFAGTIPRRVLAHDRNDLISVDDFDQNISANTKKKRRRKYFFMTAWIVLTILFTLSIVFPEKIFVPSNMILRLLLRSILIVLTWVVIINPFLIKLLHRWLEKKKTQSEGDIREISMLLPMTQMLIVKSWKLSSRERGIKRIPLFFEIIIFNSLQHG